MTPSPLSPEGADRNPILFGDNHELVLERVHEEIGARSGEVEEAVVFFTAAHGNYALRLAHDSSVDGLQFSEEDRAIVMPQINLPCFLDLLQRSSEELLSMAEQVHIDTTDNSLSST